MMKILDKAQKILSIGYVCDHCLGRQFAQLLKGYRNDKRGQIIRNFLAFALESGEKLEVDLKNFYEFEFRFAEVKPKKPNKCKVCGSFFDREIEKFAQKAKKKLKGLEFHNFLVGTKLTGQLVSREEKLWDKVGIEFCEPIKAEINRSVGRILEKDLKKPAEFLKPDVVVVLDLKNGEVEVNINSLYIYGEYNKLVRGIPQTKWPSGKYKNSVEQIIAKPVMKITKGEGHKFHGCGREDIDAKCFAGRPFILEIVKPKKRKISLRKIREKVNKTGKVKVKNLRFVDVDLVEQVKRWKPDKTYKVLVKTKDKIKDENLKKLKNLVGEIYQETPTRVLHRRADKLRKREIKYIKWKKLGPKKLELKIKAEAGTYIKEFVSGDKGRTYPSVREMLGTETEVKELDVLKIHLRK